MEEKLKYVSLQRGHRVLTLKDGTEIKAGDTFETVPSNIPLAYQDLVKIVAKAEEKKVVTPGTIKRTLQATPPAPVVETGEEEDLEDPIEETGEEGKKEEEKKPTKTYTKKHLGKGKYDVLDEAGVKMNEAPLTGAKATQLIEGLTA